MEDAVVKLQHIVYLITEKPGTHREEVYKSRYKNACMEFIKEEPATNVYEVVMVVTTSISEGTFYGGKGEPTQD